MYPLFENLKALCTINLDYLRWASMYHPDFPGLDLAILDHPVHGMDYSLAWMDARRLFGDNGGMSFEEYMEVLLEEGHSFENIDKQETP